MGGYFPRGSTVTSSARSAGERSRTMFCGRVVWLLAFSSVLVVLANGDLPNRQHTVVAVTSEAKVTITTTGDGKPKQNTVKSSAGEVSIRPYCHATCESSYNQLKVDDTLFIPSNGSVDIISGHHPKTATHNRVRIPSCDPLTATFEKSPNIIVYVLCHSGSWESNSLTVFGVREQSVSWSATEPYTCKLADTVKVYDVGLFFHSQEGEIYVAFASSMGLGVCSLKADTPFFIDFPSNCYWIAKLSQFDPINILVECTSEKDSQRVVAVWLFSVPDASFTLQLPQQHYDVGQIAFSANRLICATWKDTVVSLANLSEINPPSATIVTKRNVDSAHIIDKGIASQLVVVVKGGVQQYDLHAVFDGNMETTTLEGSENVLTHFDDPTCPMAQVADQHIIIPTRKDTTYGMTVLSLDGDKPEVINGIRPARFAIYSGTHVTNSTEVTVKTNAALTVFLSTTIPIGAVILMPMIVIALVLIAVVWRRKKEPVRLTASNPQQEQEHSTTSAAMVAGTSSATQGPFHINHATSRTQSATSQSGYASLPGDESDVEVLNPNEPIIMEEVEGGGGELSLNPPPPQGRPAHAEPEGQPDP